MSDVNITSNLTTGPSITSNVTTGGAGADGVGVPTGGTTGQTLTKVSSTDYDTTWSTIPGGAASTYVTVGDSSTDYPVADYTDVGAAVNAAYAGLPSAGGGIFIQSGTYSYTTPIVFGTNGKIASLRGPSAGSTFLKYSPTSGNGLTINSGNPTGHLVFEIAGITFMGKSSLVAAAQTNTNTSVGIFLGGANGAPGCHIHDCIINGFGTQEEIGANAYMLTHTGVGYSGGNGVSGTGTGLQGSLLHINTASNSGERNTWVNCNFTDPGNSIAANAIYVELAGVASNFFTQCSFDNVQMRVLGSNGITVVRDSHIEDAAFATYGEYIPFYFDSASSNMLVFSGNVIADSSNNSSTNFDTIIKHGVNLVATGNHIENYGGQTITYFADHSLNNGSSSEYISGTTIQGGGLTNISRNWAYTVPRGIGAHTNYANSYGNGFVTNSNNTVEWKVGNNVSALTADQNGVLTTVGNIELGHATDTTLSRVSSGKIAVEGVDVPTISSTDTFTNKTLTAPRFANGGFIADANGNEQIVFNTSASAVNEFTITNGATGLAPTLAASGGDTNITAYFKGKGSGSVVMADGNSVQVIEATGVSSAVNYNVVSNSATGNAISQTATGSDTNISINLVPKGAGRVQSAGVTVPTISSTDTLTNKRVSRRVVAVTSSATPTSNTDNADVLTIAALAAAITNMSTNQTGTPAAGDILIWELTDNGTARAISWGSLYEASGTISLPTTTVISTLLTVAFRWNPATSKWRCAGVS